MGVESSQSKPISSQEVHHPYFHNVQIDNQREIMQITVPIESEAEFEQFQANLECLSNFDEYYLLLPKEYEFMKKGICGSNGLLKIRYDNYPYLLEDEIGNRMGGQNHFSEMEMWYLIYGLVSTANLFEELGIKIGDVRPSNIFINEDGQVKIGNLLAWPNEKTNYEKYIFDQVLTYLSPEELKCSKEGHSDIYAYTEGLHNKKKPITGITKANGTVNGEGGSKIGNLGKVKSSISGEKKLNGVVKNSNSKLDKFLCESFSIGITMLESATLKRSSELYNRSSIDKELLYLRVKELLNNKDYGISLKLTILGLCEINILDRLSAVEIYHELKEFDSQIVNLKTCEIQIPKMKNMNKYTHLFKNLQISVTNTPQRDTRRESVEFNPTVQQMNSQVLWVHSGIPHYSEEMNNRKREEIDSSENTYVNFPISTINSQNYDHIAHTSTPTFNSNPNITFSNHPQNTPGVSTHQFQYQTQINQHYQPQIQQFSHQHIYRQEKESKPQLQHLSQHAHLHNLNIPQVPQFPIETAQKSSNLFVHNNQINNSNPSNFSNLSSIPHQSDYGSVQKLSEDLNVFTPTNSFKKANEKELGEGFDLLRKIDEGILDSQKKFWSYNI